MTATCAPRACAAELVRQVIGAAESAGVQLLGGERDL
jgi:hypothetical protein